MGWKHLYTESSSVKDNDHNLIVVTTFEIVMLTTKVRKAYCDTERNGLVKKVELKL